jgi:hypothetical protein
MIEIQRLQTLLADAQNIENAARHSYAQRITKRYADSAMHQSDTLLRAEQIAEWLSDQLDSLQKLPGGDNLFFNEQAHDIVSKCVLDLRARLRQMHEHESAREQALQRKRIYEPPIR